MVNQLVPIVSGLPRLYAQVGQWLHGQFDYELPPISNLSWTILGSIKTDSIGSFASQALNTAGSAFGAMLDLPYRYFGDLLYERVRHEYA